MSFSSATRRPSSLPLSSTFQVCFTSCWRSRSVCSPAFAVAWNVTVRRGPSASAGKSAHSRSVAGPEVVQPGVEDGRSGRRGRRPGP